MFYDDPYLRDIHPDFHDDMRRRSQHIAAADLAYRPHGLRYFRPVRPIIRRDVQVALRRLNSLNMHRLELILQDVGVLKK